MKSAHIAILARRGGDSPPYLRPEFSSASIQKHKPATRNAEATAIGTAIQPTPPAIDATSHEISVSPRTQAVGTPTIKTQWAFASARRSIGKCIMTRASPRWYSTRRTQTSTPAKGMPDTARKEPKLPGPFTL